MAKKVTFNGPGGTVYTQVAKTSKGRLGVARLNSNSVRVRIEPSADAEAKMAAKLEGWKQPEKDNRRFSKVTSNAGMEKVVAFAKKVVGSDTAMTAKAALAG